MSFATFVVLLGAASAAPASAAPRWDTDIAPILRSHCAGCHNDGDLEGGLSVETYARLRAGGDDHGDPVKPGDATGSFLLRSLEGLEKPVMPPKDEPRVAAESVAVLRAWIAAGAPGPGEDVSILRVLRVPAAPAASAPAPVTAAGFSPDGSLLALARGGSIEVQASTTLDVLRRFDGLPDKVNAVHFSSDGTHLVVAGGIPGLMGVAQVRAAESGVIIREFGGHRDVLADAEFSPDGTQLTTAGYDRVIKLWNLADGSLVRTIDVHKGAVHDLAWDPSGAVLASASADETIKLWRVSDGERLDTLNQPQGEMMAVHFTPDGQYIVGAGADKRLHLWKFVSRTEPALNPPLAARFAHEAPIIALALSDDGRFLLSSAEDRSVKQWSLPALELMRDFGPQRDITPVLLIAAQAGGDHLFAHLDGTWTRHGIGSGSGGSTPPPKEAVDGPAAITDVKPPQPAVPMTVAVDESEPNDSWNTAQRLAWPVTIKGTVSAAGDSDHFRFPARAGQELTLEVNAARAGSKLDSRLEVLHAATGEPVEQVMLQATRDSWFTFRGKDSDTSDDFRLQNWREMELNEYLYSKGEVVKLWLYPRGPDSGFKVYPGGGRRWTYFSTPALVHALGEPAYIVKPLTHGATPAPNGLPVFRLNYENDDDPMRRFGADSLLLFTTPSDGEYLVRLTDVRGFGAPEGFGYSLAIRESRPDFVVHVGGRDTKVSPGSGREIVFTAERHEGFDGPIRIEATGLPPGFSLSTPVEIEVGQITAIGVLHAEANAVAPDPTADAAVKITATATINGQSVTKDLGNLGDLQLAPPAKVLVTIASADGHAPGPDNPPLEFTLLPGQTITARVKTTRVDFDGRIELGGDDSGRNLPHGVFVDNIGLNGLLIVEGQTEREFFITASPVTTPGSRLFHLRATADGGQASRPARLTILPLPQAAASR
ncbi:MAG: c-type cytochrome domain-containing protein [Verrucomicrobiales bacterium]